MSMHKSLKSGNELARHRNVLTREERLEKLDEARRFNEEEDSIWGLPKVRNIKVVSKKKKKKAPGEEEGEAAAGETPAAEAAEA
jgi:small basic protein (TIGR04137 family)